MLGAIAGDIAGSVYEWNNIKTKDFPIYSEKCFFTDDTVMTCAVAEAIMNGGTHEDFIRAMKKYGRKYPGAGYGCRFSHWLFSDSTEPYNSFGNGSAMRVAPCGWAADIKKVGKIEDFTVPDEVRILARTSAEVTHDHPEGIKGAMAVADAIYIARCYSKSLYPYGCCRKVSRKCKEHIKEHTERVYGYDLSHTLDEIRPSYRFNETCQGTVPQAITAYLESTSFDDAIRNAVSLGGDSDTLAAITGSIAEAEYGVPCRTENKLMDFLDDDLRSCVFRWRNYCLIRFVPIMD